METRRRVIADRTILSTFVLCLALFWSPWSVAGTLGAAPDVVVTYPAAASAAYWTAVVLLAIGCAMGFAATRPRALRRRTWRLCALAVCAGACAVVAAGVFVEPALATRLWDTYFAPVALVAHDPAALLASGSDTFFQSLGYGFWAVLAATMVAAAASALGLVARD